MVELVTQYFLSHNEVLLPGIGCLSSTRLPSKYDEGRQLMLPPRFQFSWQPADEVSFPLQPLMGFISKHSGQPEEDCFEALHQWSAGVKADLLANGEWNWNGLGKLVMISGAKIGFVPDAGLEQYAPVIAAKGEFPSEVTSYKTGEAATEISNTEMQMVSEEGETAPGGRWWIPALIIGLSAIALIAARLSGRL